MSLLAKALQFLLGHPQLLDLLAGAVPLLLLGVLLFARRGHPESMLEILTAFSLGLLATLPVTMLAMPSGPAAPGLWGAARSAFVDASLVEESCKLLALFWLVARAPDRRPLTILISGLVLGLGFATMENFLFMTRGTGGLLLRTLSTAPCHAFLGAVMAMYLARHRSGGGAAALVKAWAVPFVLHGLYDLPLMMETGKDTGLVASNALLSALVLALLAAWTRFLLTALARVQPVEVRPVAEQQALAGGAGDDVNAA